MQKAFIFDMDGVLADTEPFWEAVKEQVFKEFLDRAVIERIGSTIGINMDGMYDLATMHGATLDKKAFFDAFYKKADWVYGNATLTPCLEELGDALKRLGYSIATVSASPKDWMDIIIDRLPFKESIGHIISLEDRKDLAHKPAPDGYIEAMQVLGSSPQTTVILEDSNAGIASAKAAGAYTIGLRENLIEGYKQVGADIYVDTLSEVIQVLEDLEKVRVALEW